MKIAVIFKRCADMTVSSILLLLLAPVFIAAGLAVWLGSGSPILFRQERVGRAFRSFQILKFRTMRPGGGRAITAAGDARVTRIGKLLRRTKLDELPQLWNVLRGDMSLVGPRPELPVFVEQFKSRYQSILTVRPGMTDLASIRFINEEEILAGVPDPITEYVNHVLPLKLTLAEEYAGSAGFSMDLHILFRTMLAVLGRR